MCRTNISVCCQCVKIRELSEVRGRGPVRGEHSFRSLSLLINYHFLELPGDSK